MHNRLPKLLFANRQLGSFKAEANAIFVYDSIVGSPTEAEWWGGVDAQSFAKTLGGMAGDVSVHIDSPGGDVFAGRAMAQAIRSYPGKVTAFVDGVAASAATFLTAAADRVVMADGAMLMVHRAWSFTMGNAQDHLSQAALLDKIDGTIAESYTKAAAGRGVTAPDFAALMAAETWLTGEEAIAAGLADELAQTGPKAAIAWDLSAYLHAPGNAEPAALENATGAAAVAVLKGALRDKYARIRADLSADMSARQAQLYGAIEDVAGELGPFDQGSGANGAHYMPASPFAEQGIRCANCAFYDGAQKCEVVEGSIAPEGVCKLWIIPENLLSDAAAAALSQTEIDQHARPNIRADMLIRPPA